MTKPSRPFLIAAISAFTLWLAYVLQLLAAEIAHGPMLPIRLSAALVALLACTMVLSATMWAISELRARQCAESAELRAHMDAQHCELRAHLDGRDVENKLRLRLIIKAVGAGPSMVPYMPLEKDGDVIPLPSPETLGAMRRLARKLTQD